MFIDGTQIEIINSNFVRGKVQFAIFDFDGTLSLIREGWQSIMIPMMVDILMQTPSHETEDQIKKLVKQYVTDTTGKQTIYQMIRLKEEVIYRGGVPLDPLEYKHKYHNLLMDKIVNRITGLRDGFYHPQDWVVTGSFDALDMMRKLGIECFLASGTDEKYVFDEAELLKVSPYFKKIYGALDDYQNYSKKMVIDRIIKDNNLSGPELIAFGDGYVEIENTKSAGGIAIGVATDEAERKGIDSWKRERLIQSGADIIIPDFLEIKPLMGFLLKGN